MRGEVRDRCCEVIKMKPYEKAIEDLSSKGISLVTYWCGLRHEETDLIEQADFGNYNYSGIILGDKAVLMVNDYGMKTK